MVHGNNASVVVKLPARKRKRKDGINTNKHGSVRNVNGYAYIDFIYLGERVRENSGRVYSEKNVNHVRDKLDKIIVQIKDGTFRYADVFPYSKKKKYFTEKERLAFKLPKKPDEVAVGEYCLEWLKTLRESGRVTGRTLRDYKSYLDNYIVPYLGKLTFADLNKMIFEKFIAWSRNLKLKDKVISNGTINNMMVPLKTICKDVAIEHNWGLIYNPFFGFKKPKEDDSYEKIHPFSMKEQRLIAKHIPEHWNPYVKFAFCTGLRHGEQTGIKADDIDWEKGLLHIRRAMTLDEKGKVIEGRAKNSHSRRPINLSPRMLKILTRQKAIHEQLGSEYFFCTPDGNRVDTNNLRKKAWTTALVEAKIPYRDLKQTRHSFATTALSNGVNPLFIARMMGHRNTDMIIRVYGKYVENNTINADVNVLDGIFGITKKRKGK